MLFHLNQIFVIEWSLFESRRLTMLEISSQVLTWRKIQSLPVIFILTTAATDRCPVQVRRSYLWMYWTGTLSLIFSFKSPEFRTDSISNHIRHVFPNFLLKVKMCCSSTRGLAMFRRRWFMLFSVHYRVLSPSEDFSPVSVSAYLHSDYQCTTASYKNFEWVILLSLP